MNSLLKSGSCRTDAGVKACLSASKAAVASSDQRNPSLRAVSGAAIMP